jgi:hypothetical protein
VDKRCKTAAPEQFRDAGLVVAALRVQNCLLKDREIAMQKEQARESNVFQLNTRVRKLDKTRALENQMRSRNMSGTGLLKEQMRRSTSF